MKKPHCIRLLALLALSILSTPVAAVVYSPETGTTQYPDGTIYCPFCEKIDGMATGTSSGPGMVFGRGEQVDCNDNEERCRELLEAAITGNEPPPPDPEPETPNDPEAPNPTGDPAPNPEPKPVPEGPTEPNEDPANYSSNSSKPKLPNFIRKDLRSFKKSIKKPAPRTAYIRNKRGKWIAVKNNKKHYRQILRRIR